MNVVGFGLFSVFPFLIFGLVIAVFVVALVRGLLQWDRNNHSPRLTVDATVVAKRTHVSGHHRHGSNGSYHHSTSNSYYVTFQFESGDRLEMHVPGSEFGMLIEGDAGKLTFQGTRYLSFERIF
jgi:hypothetical protein